MHRISFFLFLGITVFFAFGCSENSSSSSGDNESPFAELEPSGVWLGKLIYESDTANPVFVIGVITKEREVRLIGEKRQYAGPEGSMHVTAGTPILAGSLYDYQWDEAATDYDAVETVLSMSGYIATRALLWGAFHVQETDEPGSFALFYNTTYTESPNVGDLVGEWQIDDVLHEGNTVSLFISLSNVADTTRGNISVSDQLANVYNTGTIEIHYSEGVPYNVYDVSFGLNGEELAGLATFVEEMNTEGIEIPTRTLAIGATNEDGTRSFTGLAIEGISD